MPSLLPSIDAVIEPLQHVIHSLDFCCKTLLSFKPQDDENCFSATELASFAKTLTQAITLAEQCYSEYTRFTALSSQSEQTAVAATSEYNPLIRADLGQSLSEIVNTIQFLISTFEQIPLAEQQYIYNSVELCGMANTINTIKLAASHCLMQSQQLSSNSNHAT